MTRTNEEGNYRKKADDWNSFLESVDCRVLTFLRKDIACVLWCCMDVDTGRSLIRDSLSHQCQSHDTITGSCETRLRTSCTPHQGTSCSFPSPRRSQQLISDGNGWSKTTGSSFFGGGGGANTGTEGVLPLRLGGSGVFLLLARLNSGMDTNERVSVVQSHLVLKTPESRQIDHQQ